MLTWEEFTKCFGTVEAVKQNKGTIEVEIKTNKKYKDFPCTKCKKKDYLCSHYLCVKALKFLWSEHARGTNKSRA